MIIRRSGMRLRTGIPVATLSGWVAWPEEKPRAAAEAPKGDSVAGPLVFWHSQPVRSNGTLMLAGARLEAGTVVEACPLPDADPGRPAGAALSDKGIG